MAKWCCSVTLLAWKSLILKASSQARLLVQLAVDMLMRLTQWPEASRRGGSQAGEAAGRPCASAQIQEAEGRRRRARSPLWVGSLPPNPAGLLPPQLWPQKGHAVQVQG